MRTKAISLLCLICFFTAGHGSFFGQSDSADYVSTRSSDEKPKKPKDDRTFKDKFYFGGGLGLSFGTVTSIAVDPLVGWKWTPKFSSGLAISYWYFRDNRFEPPIQSHNYGFRVFNRYKFIPQAYAHLEYAQFFHDFIDTGALTGGRVNIPYLFIGGGYIQPIGNRSSFYIQALYDLIQDTRSVYRASGDLFITAGVAVGF